jgi:DNA-binding HxlR family transcriptional regulator
VLGNGYSGQNCSIARTLEVVGERWSPLIVRDLLLGITRFDEIKNDLGIATNVLQTRLNRLMAEGIVIRHVYQQRPLRHEYRLTEKGLGLWPTIVALMQWGDRYAPSPGGAPMIIKHRGCDGMIDEHRICERCGERVAALSVLAAPGPGASENDPLIARRGADMAIL